MAKKRILIVDDEADFTHLVKINLEAAGSYEVRTENEGLNVLAAVKEFKPNLILLDIVMPDMDGGDVAFQLNDDESTRDIPIVFLTAIATKEDVEKGKGLINGYHFLAKPVTTEELIRCIEKIVI
ncbi:MAG: response regulator [Candidatus Omnitrophota bacterium]